MSVTIQYTDLSQQERSMLDAFRHGAAWGAKYYRTWCERNGLTCDIPDPPKTAQARDKDKAKAKDEAQDGAQHKDDYPLTVRGLVVRAAILGDVVDEAGLPIIIDERGVRVFGADVTQEFELTGGRFCKPLRFRMCRFENIVDFCDADLGYVSFADCEVRQFYADRIAIRNGLFLGSLRNCSFISLRAAKIAKFLSLRNTKLSGARNVGEMWALDCTNATVKGNVFLWGGYRAVGVTNFVGADISANLFLNGAELSSQPVLKENGKKGGNIRESRQPDPCTKNCALYVHNAHIGGSVYLTKGFQARGVVNFSMTHIGGNLNCQGGKIEGKPDSRHRNVSLYCANADIGSGLYLNDSCYQGEVVFSTARVGAEMDCSSAEFQNPSAKDTVLSCDNMTVGTNVFLRRLRADGGLNFNMIRIGASLRAESCWIKVGSDGRALYCNGADIRESVFLTKADVFGQVNFVYAKVGGRFVCTDGNFIYNPLLNDEKQRAINGDSISVGGSVFLGSSHPNGRAVRGLDYKGFSAKGEVFLSNAKIGGNLFCMGGAFVNGDNASLVCSFAHIGGSAYLTKGFTATGEVFFRDAVIHGHFYCRNGSFNDGLTRNSTVENAAARCALDLGSAHIDGVLYLTGVQSVVGELNLCDAFAHGLAEDGSTWNPNWRGGPRPSASRRFRSWCVGGWRHVRLAFGRCVRRLRGRIPSGPPEDGTVIADKRVSENGCIWTLSDTDGGPGAILRFCRWHQRWCAKGYSFARHIPRALVRRFFRIWGPVEDGDRTCVIKLDHFTYDVFVDDERLSEDDGTPERWENGNGGVPKHAGAATADVPHGSKTDLSWLTRLAWLRAQPSDYLGAHFRPQPFTQCAKVLRNMGHFNEARRILQKREGLRLRHKNVRRIERVTRQWFLGATSGYGYRMSYAFFWTIGVWLVGALIYWQTDNLGQMRLSSEPTAIGFLYTEGNRQYVPTDYEPLSPMMYSLDVLLPVVNLGQDSDWIPRDWEEGLIRRTCPSFVSASSSRKDKEAGCPSQVGMLWKRLGRLPKVYYWIEILAGWFLTFIIITGFSGLLGHQRED